MAHREVPALWRKGLDLSQDIEIADAVAVIGMSCRFSPDLDSPDRLWSFLVNGGSSVRDMPDRRWEPYAASSPQATAIMRNTTRLGSFLDDIEGFDADFFGISPREADFLDPQQRILLELAWEALVRAGVPPLALRGTEAAVFAAANSNDYGRRLLEDIPLTGAYAVNGTTYYGIANRISYFLDLRGPSMAVDTACAGSLTALHLACQSIRLGETPVAIVGGVNIMATPALFVALDAAGATSPDGRSKAFDKAADGYGRGEGAGVVVLKKLADARRDGDPVLALVVGSGVFQDGRSDGMMAPNSEAQEHMLRQVYDRAGIEPRTVGYVEAHGTGTPVGDREEAQALAKVFGAGRPPGEPCLIGSLKPNIGHVEGGSGIAGVIKAVLALWHGEIPPSLHSEPHPGVDWETSGLRLVGERSPWRSNGTPRRAGVSSYGVGGTIAHLVLQEAPADLASTVDDEVSDAAVFPLSAMSEPGLRALAGKTAEWLRDHPDVPLASVGHTLARRRSHLAQRAAITAATTAELAAGLSALAEERRVPGVVDGRAASGQASEVVWVFSGHGAQWPGMGRQLLREDPAFAEAIDSLADVFRAELGWTPREAIAEGGPWTAAQIQAMTFAMQVGLAAVWRRRGVTPGAVIGHSVGEIAAAVVAGSLDVRQAARFACRRAKALRRAEGPGAMAMVGLPWQDCADRLAGDPGVVPAIAASPGSTVVSGDREAVERLAEQWRADGIDVRRVDTNIAFHSHHVDDVTADVAAAAAELDPRAPQIPLYSTALADPRTTAPRDTDYWTTNLRQPVRFAQAVEAAVADGHRLFVELSPHPVVIHSIMEAFEHLGVEDGTAVPSTRRDSDEVATLLGSLGKLYCGGAAVDWPRQHAGGSLADLPAAAWQHRPYWIFPEHAADAGFGGGHDPDRHTLLGGYLTVSGAPARQVWQTRLDLSCRPYPLSHEVVGVEITPAAVLINTFVAAAARNGDQPGLHDLFLRTPVAVTPPRVVQIVHSGNTVHLSTRIADGPAGDEDQEWLTHCGATVDRTLEPTERHTDIAAVRERCAELMDWSAVDGMFRRQGVGGYAFPWDIEELRRNEREQLAVMTIEPAPARHAASWAHVIDGALTISAVVVTPEDARRLWMSTHIGSVVFRGEPPARIAVHSRRSPQSPEDTVDVTVSDETGRVVCEVRGLRFASLQDEPGAVAAARDLVHETVWHPFPVSDGDRSVRRLVVVGDGSVAGRLHEQFTGLGLASERLLSPEDLRPESLAGVDAVLVAPEPAGPGEPAEQAAESAAWTLVRTVQRLTHVRDDGLRLWCLTQGVRTAEDEASLAHAALWGTSRIIAGEHPELWGGVVDVDRFGDGTGQALLPLLRHAAGVEDVISLTGRQAAVPRLSPIERPEDGTTLRCDPAGSYLITGGLGALGLAVSQWLVDRGARRLLLAGRRGLPPRAEWDAVRDTRTRRQIEGVLALEARGATVRVLALDTGDADALARAVAPSTHGLPAVRGIIHAAGVVRDAMVDKVDRDGLHEVLWPKVAGAMVLHRLFPPGSLDFFVFFSSCGQFARLTGQTSYAAANSFLDVLAAHRQAGGRTDTVSLAWTAWRGMGMSETIAGTMLEANSRGLDAISFSEAFRAWSFADRFAGPYKAIMRVRPLPAGAPRVPMYRELNAVEEEGATGFALDWAGLSEAEQQELVTADIREQVAAELNLAASDVELKRPLVELGVDSVMTVALRVRLQRRYGLDLPPNILWSKPTVAALGGHVADELRPRETPADEREPITATDEKGVLA
ncbi:type I polyketide synthase [Actinosynnema sp. CS-041913]|uniref:type I polyketide synthase n=1 Tax=Actinosynnema sp. CS-041913 TaxID=3239917 RepID=UPI003D938821